MVESSEVTGPLTWASLGAALQNAHPAAALVDRGRVVFVSAALHRLLGACSPAEALENLSRAIAPLFERALLSPGLAVRERLVIPRSSNSRELDLSILPLLHPEHAWYGAFAEPANASQAETARLASAPPPRATTNPREGGARALVREFLLSLGPRNEPTRLVDLEQLLDTSIEFVWAAIGQRARWVKRYRRVGNVRGHEATLGPIFLRLLKSAAESIEMNQVTERGEVTLSTAAAGDQVIVEVVATRSGVRDPKRPSAAERPFASPLERPAIALELSLCRAILTAQGGDLSVEHSAGKKTTFRACLPARGCESLPPPRQPEAALSRAAWRARILVIDDEPLLGQTLLFAFSGEHDLVVTSSGREALAVLAKDVGFDLVLCDLMMPDITGRKVFETVQREHPELVDRFVFMTGGAFTESAQQFLEHYPGRRLEKPFSTSEVERLLVGAQRAVRSPSSKL